ncbi:MAG TPA: hypothetical protein VFI43_06750 [Nitrosospira sp.]|nr:hypothetical protein [Nitrosospira sp.]
MTSSPLFTVHPCVMAVALIVLGTGAAHAQFTSSGSANEQIAQLGPGQGVEVIGQPPGSMTSSIIGSPVPGQRESSLGLPSVLNQPAPGQERPGQEGLGSRPNPGIGSSAFPMERNVVREKLNRTNREAADIDRNGRISSEEASRLPPGSLPPGVPLGVPLSSGPQPPGNSRSSPLYR